MIYPILLISSISSLHNNLFTGNISTPGGTFQILNSPFEVDFNCPPYCLVEDKSGSLIVSGGGGNSKTGLSNKIVTFNSLSFNF